MSFVAHDYHIIASCVIAAESKAVKSQRGAENPSALSLTPSKEGHSVVCSDKGSFTYALLDALAKEYGL